MLTTLGLASAALVSGGLLASGVVSADDSGADRINVIIPSACTLTGTGNSSHTATVSPNSYQADIGTTTLKAICNDADGFAIYAAGYTGDTVGDTNSTKLVGANTNQLISTGIGTSGDSQWAMKLATDSGAAYPITIESAPNVSGGANASFASYHVVPSDYTKVATRLSATDGGENATGSVLTTTYAVNISSAQVSDTYNGKVKYTLVHPNDAPTPVEPLKDTDCPANKICYAPNNGDIDGSMDSISPIKITKSATAGVQNAGSNGFYTLIAPNYSLAGYGFAGWSPEFDAINATNPTIYGPNETIITGDLSSHGLILYPVWIKSAGNLQGWTGCSSLTTAPKPSTGNTATLASMTALTDSRDNNTYAVARLSDGNCWMVENLRLNESVSASLINSGSQGIGGDFTTLPNSENANFDNVTTANNLYNTGNANTMPRYNSNNTNRSLTASYNGSGSTTYYQWYSYGNYYTWAAAMANTNSLTSYSASESAGTSLCPTGWHIPTGGDKTRITTDNNNEFWNLVVVNLNNNTLPANYGSSSTPYYNGSTEAGPVDKLVRAFPNNFVYSGYFNTASATNRSSRGYYWSSSADSSNFVYTLDFTSMYVYPGAYFYSKYNGRTVRCLFSS